MRGQVDRGDAIYYIMAQLLGGAVAAFFAVFLLNCDSSTEIRPLNHTAACSVLAEFLGAFALVYVVLNVTAARSRPNLSEHGIKTVAMESLCFWACNFFRMSVVSLITSGLSYKT